MHFMRKVPFMIQPYRVLFTSRTRQWWFPFEQGEVMEIQRLIISSKPIGQVEVIIYDKEIYDYDRLDTFKMSDSIHEQCLMELIEPKPGRWIVVKLKARTRISRASCNLLLTSKCQQAGDAR